MSSYELVRTIGVSVGVIGAVIGAVVTIINNIAQRKSHKKIVYNDLHHLSADVKLNTTKIEELNKTVGVINSNVSYIKGMLDKNKGDK